MTARLRQFGVVIAALALVALAVTACANPDRVRSSGPLHDPPPLPLAKPLAWPTAQPSLAEVATPPAVPERPSHHRVAAGDTLYGVSRRYNVPLRALIDSNRLTPPYRLQVGQSLVVPRVRVHTVVPGDTVYGLSRAYGVDAAELVRVNDIPPPYGITLGQRLIIPATSASAPLRTASAPVSAAAPASRAPSTVEQPLLPPATKPRDLAPATSPAPSGAPQPVARVETSREAPKPAAVPSPPPRVGGKFQWPVQGKVVSRFGTQKDGRHNDGINIAAASGSTVVAAENGVVAYAGNELRGFGNLLLIKHSGGWVTAYAHNESLLARRGATVKRGQAIAKVGTTGSVSAPQLHFEIRKGTRAIDPLQLLDQR
jgi:murein DD-endopeptidase MepM/ murein hydrolase activator NlpD